MKYDDIIQKIETSTSQDWVLMEHRNMEIAVYKDDVRLRIEMDYESNLINDDFQEEWANKHADKKAKSYAYYVYYNSTIVVDITLVSIDGGRASMPLPDRSTMTPKLLDYKVAEIMNEDALSKYLPRCGFKLPSGA